MFERKSPATFSGRMVVSSNTTDVGASGVVEIVRRNAAI